MYNLTNKSVTSQNYYAKETYEIMRVPAKICGMLIGNKGEKINDLQLDVLVQKYLLNLMIQVILKMV